MCIAIVKPAHIEIEKSTLELCHESNKDGCGFAYINTDNRGVKRIKTRKSLDFETFYRQYTKALELAPDSPFLIHFRIKTHGKINVSNCHPFKIDKNHAFIHNGTIAGVPRNEEKSDTMMFNEEVLQELPKGWIKNKAIKKLVEDFIGYSKIAVLDLEGGYHIFNEEKGTWDNGVWYSNSSYKPKPVYTPSTVVPYNGGKYTGGVGMSQIYTPPTSFIGKSVMIFSRTIEDLEKNRDAKKYRVFDDDSRIQCDHCGKYKQVNDLFAYYKHSSVLCFCRECETKTETWEYLDPEVFLSVDAHLDWLNGVQLKMNEDPTYFERWDNPWLPEDFEEDVEDRAMMQEIVDTEEIFEGVYQEAMASGVY